MNTALLMQMSKISQNIIPLEVISLLPPLLSFLNLLKDVFALCPLSYFCFYNILCLLFFKLYQPLFNLSSLIRYILLCSSYIWKCFFFMSVFGEPWGCLSE